MQIHQSKVNVKFVFLVPGNAWPQLPGLGKWKVQTESLNLLLHPCLPCIPGIGTLLLGKKFVFYGVVRIRIVQINFLCDRVHFLNRDFLEYLFLSFAN